MAVVAVPHQPQLTPNQAMQAFKEHFRGRYEVYRVDRDDTSGRDFVVKKDGQTAVRVRLDQHSDSTEFVFTGFPPSFLLRMLLVGLVAYPVLRPGWKEMESEIRSYIENAAQFNGV